jgi:hypothetical protein
VRTTYLREEGSVRFVVAEAIATEEVFELAEL